MAGLRQIGGQAERLSKSVLALFVPQTCLVCGTNLGACERWTCRLCGAEILMGARLHERSLDLSCGRPLKIWSGLEYTADVSKLIREMKYSDKPALGVALARLMWGVMPREVVVGQAFVPVPLHPARKRERGYNQSEILGRELARLGNSEVLTRVLGRRRNTPSQAMLDREKRLENVAGCFRVTHPCQIRSRKVMLVDDVVTTGSTLMECAEALLENGAEDVEACAVASRDF